MRVHVLVILSMFFSCGGCDAALKRAAPGPDARDSSTRDQMKVSSVHMYDGSWFSRPGSIKDLPNARILLTIGSDGAMSMSFQQAPGSSNDFTIVETASGHAMEADGVLHGDLDNAGPQLGSFAHFTVSDHAGRGTAELSSTMGYVLPLQHLIS